MKKKKIILSLALIGMVIGLQAQVRRQYLDTISYERDTIIYYHTENGAVYGTWYVYADTLEGTKNGLIELVIANDYLYGVASSRAMPDSLFVRYSSVSYDSLTAVKPILFKIEQPLYCDYVGLRFSLDSISKWHFYSKLMLKITK